MYYDISMSRMKYEFSLPIGPPTQCLNMHRLLESGESYR